MSLLVHGVVHAGLINPLDHVGSNKFNNWIDIQIQYFRPALCTGT